MVLDREVGEEREGEERNRKEKKVANYSGRQAKLVLSRWETGRTPAELLPLGRVGTVQCIFSWAGICHRFLCRLGSSWSPVRAVPAADIICGLGQPTPSWYTRSDATAILAKAAWQPGGLGSQAGQPTLPQCQQPRECGSQEQVPVGPLRPSLQPFVPSPPAAQLARWMRKQQGL